MVLTSGRPALTGAKGWVPRNLTPTGVVPSTVGLCMDNIISFTGLKMKLI